MDIGKIIEEAMKEAIVDIGEVKILIAGKTGVGKSTLINAVFQGDNATVGQGRPIAKVTFYYPSFTKIVTWFNVSNAKNTEAKLK